MTIAPLKRITAGYRRLHTLGLVGHNPKLGPVEATHFATEQLYAVAHLVHHARGHNGVPQAWIYNHHVCAFRELEEELLALLFDEAVTADDLIAWGNVLARAVTISETIEDTE